MLKVERDALARNRTQRHATMRSDKAYRKQLEAQVKEKLAALIALRLKNPESGVVVPVEYLPYFYRNRLLFTVPGADNKWMTTATRKMIRIEPNGHGGKPSYSSYPLSYMPNQVLEDILKASLPDE